MIRRMERKMQIFIRFLTLLLMFISLPFMLLAYHGLRLFNKFLKKFNKDKQQLLTKTGIEIKRTLSAHVTLACRKCGAPGIYKNHPSIKEGWPDCYVEADDERLEQPVGDTCPNCGSQRPKNVQLGTIWTKTI